MSEWPELIIDDRVVMLLYRLTMDHEGSASESEVKDFGVWAEPTIDVAITSGWVHRDLSTDTLEITSDGRESLSRVLDSRRTIVFGGSVPDEGPHFRIVSQKMENVWYLQQGLTREDFDRVLNSEDYEAVYKPRTLGFPDRRHFHITFVWGPNRNHPLAGHTIDPRGYPGRYVVTLILHRQGAPDNPRAVQMDQGNWKETRISVYRKSLVGRGTLKDNGS